MRIKIEVILDLKHVRKKNKKAKLLDKRTLAYHPETNRGIVIAKDVMLHPSLVESTLVCLLQLSRKGRMKIHTTAGENSSRYFRCLY